MKKKIPTLFILFNCTLGIQSFAAEKCDYKKYPGNGCTDGMICFEGTSQPQGPPPPVQKMDVKGLQPQKLIGHCLTKCDPAPCNAKVKCEEKTIFQGDVQAFHGKLCLE